MRFSIKHLMIAVASIGYVLAAYIRGDYLLGFRAGTLYALVGIGMAFLLIRAFSSQSNFKWEWRLIVTFLAVLLTVVFSFPANFNESLSDSVETRQFERMTNAQMRQIIRSDPRFSRISVRSKRGRKQSVVTFVRGRVDTRADLESLRHRFFSECPSVSQSGLHWNLTITKTGTEYQGFDSDIFAESQDDAG